MWYLDIQGCLSNTLICSADPDPDPVGSADPEPYPIEPNVKLNFTFSREFQYTVQNTENFDTYDADKKDKTIYTGTAVNKNQLFFFWFSILCKTWG